MQNQLENRIKNMETRIDYVENSHISEIRAKLLQLEQNHFKIFERFSDIEERFTTLQAHIDEQFSTYQKEMNERFSTQQKEMNERFSTQQKEMDERFSNQQKGMYEGFSNQQKEMNERFSNQQKEMNERFSNQQKGMYEGFLDQQTIMQGGFNAINARIARCEERISDIHASIAIQTRWLFAGLLGAATLISIAGPIVAKTL